MMKKFLIIMGILYFLFPISVFADIAPDFSVKVGDKELISSYNIIYYVVGSIIILLAIGITVKHFKDKKKVSNIVNPPVG